MDAGTIVTGTGSAGVLLLISYLGRLALDWWRNRDTPRNETAGAVTDAAAANALLLASLRETKEREDQLSGQVENLRSQNARLYEQVRQQRRDHERDMDALRAEYEKEIAALKSQVDDFAQRLTDLQTRLSGGDHPA